MRTCPQCGGEYPDDAAFCVKDGHELGATEAEVEELPALLKPGATLGKYRILEVIGTGGMGVVYLAEHAALRRRVALKLLKPEKAVEERVIRRFFAEARAANAVGHENVIEISDFVETGPHKYFVMEHLLGASLTEALRTDGPFPPARAMHVALQMAESLAAVHDAGIVHRDLKPDNIFLTTRARQRDFVKLLDFGVAKLSEELAGDGLKSTQTGVLIGTPAYMSPEQLQGTPVDARADVYAFGAVVWELLTGRRVFLAKTLPELMYKHFNEQPEAPSKFAPDPSAVPAELDELLLACLQKQPDDRPKDMHEVVRRLSPLYDAEGFHVSLTSGEHRMPASILREPAGDPIGTATPMPETMPGLDSAPLAPARNPTAPPVPLLAGAAVVGGVLLAVAVGLGLTSEDAADAPAKPAVVVKRVTPAPSPPPVDEAPASAGAEPAEESVEIEVRSTPPGAEVFVGLEPEPRGQTPTSLELVREDAEVELHLRLEGHEIHSERVPLSADSRVQATLVPAAEDDPPAARAKKPSEEKKKTRRWKKRRRKKARTDLVDPFAR